jgi:hypothetical protein
VCAGYAEQMSRKKKKAEKVIDEPPLLRSWLIDAAQGLVEAYFLWQEQYVDEMRIVQALNDRYRIELDVDNLGDTLLLLVKQGFAKKKSIKKIIYYIPTEQLLDCNRIIVPHY